MSARRRRKDEICKVGLPAPFEPLRIFKCSKRKVFKAPIDLIPESLIFLWSWPDPTSYC